LLLQLRSATLQSVEVRHVNLQRIAVALVAEDQFLREVDFNFKNAEDGIDEMWPRDGSFVVGPIEPATKRGLAGVENWAATSFASRAAAIFKSRVCSCRSYSASTKLA
jgi:hypothetical protein